MQAHDAAAHVGLRRSGLDRLLRALDGLRGTGDQRERQCGAEHETSSDPAGRGALRAGAERGRCGIRCLGLGRLGRGARRWTASGGWRESGRPCDVRPRPDADGLRGRRWPGWTWRASPGRMAPCPSSSRVAFAALCALLLGSPCAAHAANPVVLDPSTDAIGPAVAVDAAGTAHIAWNVTQSIGVGDKIRYCRLPRGQAACAVLRTFTPDARQAVAPPRSS